MTDEFSFSGHELSYAGKTARFEREIRKVIKFRKLLIVLLSYMGGNRNIYALNQSADIVWQVQAPAPSPDEAYTDVFVEEQQLKAYTYGGNYYLINRSDGSVKNVTKGRPW